MRKSFVSFRTATAFCAGALAALCAVRSVVEKETGKSMADLFANYDPLRKDIIDQAEPDIREDDFL